MLFLIRVNGGGKMENKKELAYFTIGTSFGGNQDWFQDYWMHIGGCAAVAACDSCICLQKSKVKEQLYPYDIENITKEEYINFAMKMKPYLRPRWNGIDKLEIYIDGLTQYLKDIENTTLSIDGFSADCSVEEATELVKKQINAGFPIPFLLLRHKNCNFKELLWHWFLLVGYQEFEDVLYVKIATYGAYQYVSFQELWDSGHHNNGGMILYH